VSSLSKSLYEKLSFWIVQKLNQKISNRSLKSCSTDIGILDIFGFENFTANNSLEQLCINFTNEKIQQLYTQQVFDKEK